MQGSGLITNSTDLLYYYARITGTYITLVHIQYYSNPCYYDITMGFLLLRITYHVQEHYLTWYVLGSGCTECHATFQNIAHVRGKIKNNIH